MIMMHEHLFYGERVAPYYLGLEMPYRSRNFISQVE